MQIIDVKGNTHVYPRIDNFNIEADIPYLQSLTGIPSISPAEIATLLTKMSLKSELIESNKVKVEVPITRADILHPCDLAEDLAICYSYNKIEVKLPPTSTIGG